MNHTLFAVLIFFVLDSYATKDERPSSNPRPSPFQPISLPPPVWPNYMETMKLYIARTKTDLDGAALALCETRPKAPMGNDVVPLLCPSRTADAYTWAFRDQLVMLYRDNATSYIKQIESRSPPSYSVDGDVKRNNLIYGALLDPAQGYPMGYPALQNFSFVDNGQMWQWSEIPGRKPDRDDTFYLCDRLVNGKTVNVFSLKPRRDARISGSKDCRSIKVDRTTINTLEEPGIID